MSLATELAEQIRARLRPDARALVALAGPPGAGKSTLVTGLAAALGQSCVAMPMDGYHLDNALLQVRGHLPRKGAPWTFDTGGLARDLQRLREDEGPVLVPVFDRDLDLARAAACEILPSARIVLIEGNYLLLDDAPWAALAGFWDVSVMLEVPEPVLQARLVARWLHHGLDPLSAEARALGNDLPNARIVRARSRPADLVARTG